VTIVSKSDSKPADEEKVTVAGCVLTVIGLAAIIVSVPLFVRWCDRASRPMPGMGTVFAIIMLGATLQAAGRAILGLFDPKVPTKSAKDKIDWPEL
jgi:hypothetical protein